MTRFLSFAAMFLSAFLFTASDARASEQTELLDRAAQTAENMRRDPAFAAAREMLDRARGILIVPSLVKGGFIFGAEGGNGVLLARMNGGWSQPAFYTIGSVSFGLQAGLEQTQIVMLIMSDRAFRAILDGDFKLGAGADLTIVNLSRGAEAATPSNLAGDIIIWTSGSGLYGGLTLTGSIITPLREWNEAFYGRPVTVAQILSGEVRNPAANPLRQRLALVR